MPLGDIFGIAGLVVAFLGIAIPMLWPTGKVIGRVAIGLAVVSCGAGIYWSKRLAAEAMPDVSLKFVEPDGPFLQIFNDSKAPATNIKWVVFLWDADVSARADPLPIPAATFDELHAGAHSILINLFEQPAVAPLVKPGDHVYGSAVVTCPACARSHTYLLSAIVGKGGWYGEVLDIGPEELLTPDNSSLPAREAYYKQIELMIPRASRISIGPVSRAYLPSQRSAPNMTHPEPMWTDILTGIGTVTAVLVALFGYSIPALFSPRLKIRIDNSQGILQRAVVQTADPANPQFEAWVRYYHVRVSNSRRWRPATNVRVMLRRIEAENTAAGWSEVWRGEGIPLVWQHEHALGSARRVGPDALADMFHVVQDSVAQNRMRVLQLTPSFTPIGMEIAYLAQGVLRLTFQAKSDETDTKELRLVIRWDGQWREGDSEMSQHVRVSEE